MFVWLGDTYDIHRAHIVRGMLEAHGVRAVVWHEMPVITGFMPGWLSCQLMIPEDDAEAAREIMNARPEERQLEEETAEFPPFKKYPGFIDWLQTGLLLAGSIIAIALAGMFLGPMLSRQERFFHYQAQPAVTAGDLLALLMALPLGALAFAASTSIMMAPLVIWQKSRWVGLIAYLYIRVIFFVAFFLAAKIASLLFGSGPFDAGHEPYE